MLWAACREPWPCANLALEEGEFQAWKEPFEATESTHRVNSLRSDCHLPLFALMYKVGTVPISGERIVMSEVAMKSINDDDLPHSLSWFLQPFFLLRVYPSTCDPFCAFG